MLAPLERDFLASKVACLLKVKQDRRVLAPVKWDTFQHLLHSFIVKLKLGNELLVDCRLCVLEFSNKNKFNLASLLYSLSRLA